MDALNEYNWMTLNEQVDLGKKIRDTQVQILFQ